MKAISFLMITILLTLQAAAQTAVHRKSICGKKWHGVKYMEADGKSHPIPAEEVSNYIVYHCNGKFTSSEGGKFITGKWKLDGKTNTLTTTQSQTAPHSVTISRQVIAATNDELVIRAKEADGTFRTVYFETMN